VTTDTGATSGRTMTDNPVMVRAKNCGWVLCAQRSIRRKEGSTYGFDVRWVESDQRRERRESSLPPFLLSPDSSETPPHGPVGAAAAAAAQAPPPRPNRPTARAHKIGDEVPS
jgi:hypothetical protein